MQYTAQEIYTNRYKITFEDGTETTVSVQSSVDEIDALVSFYLNPPAPKLQPWQVIAERDRRLALGFDYDFGDERGVHTIATTPADMAGWDEVTKGAQAAINLGNPDETIQIVTETGPATVTALEWQGVLAAATAFRQPIWAASFALQAMDPIPADYADDKYWT